MSDEFERAGSPARGKPGLATGLKVLDFTWAAAGPIITKQLSDNGATVVKIESRKHPDSVRLGAPFKDSKPGINRSGFYADFNSSKLSVAIDLGSEEGRKLILDLGGWADVVVENFRPGVLDRYGLGYEGMRAVNPSVIFVSSSLYGADGPWAHLAGFGAQGAASAGIHGLTGWPDLPPAVPKGAYTDSVSPRYGLAALMAALIYRERTGKGQWIELSQIEATVQILSAELLQYQLTGIEPKRSGNAHAGRPVHGVFACAGEDRWIAIEAHTDAEWSALLGVLGSIGSCETLEKLSPLEALTRSEEVEAVIGSITSGVDAFELMEMLQQAGVASGVVLKGSDLLADPRLRQRGHFWALDHEEMGRLDYNGPAYRFERTPSELTRAAPRLGEDTEWVMRSILGLDDSEIQRLHQVGVLE